MRLPSRFGPPSRSGAVQHWQTSSMNRSERARRSGWKSADSWRSRTGSTPTWSSAAATNSYPSWRPSYATIHSESASSVSSCSRSIALGDRQRLLQPCGRRDTDSPRSSASSRGRISGSWSGRFFNTIRHLLFRAQGVAETDACRWPVAVAARRHWRSLQQLLSESCSESARRRRREPWRRTATRSSPWMLILGGSDPGSHSAAGRRR